MQRNRKNLVKEAGPSNRQLRVAELVRRSISDILIKNELYEDRTGGSIASVLYGLSQGVQLFRVHDVYETNQAIKVYSKLI